MTRIVGLLVIAGFLAFSGLPLPVLVSESAQILARPLWNVRVTLLESLRTYSVRTEDAALLREEVALLRSELMTLRRENYSARTVARDVEILRDARTLSEDRGRILSSVLLELRRGTLDAMMLDVGTEEGVRDRMLVTSPEGIGVGFVERAYQHGSFVRLFSSAGIATNVILYGTTTSRVVLEGLGAGSMSIRTPKDMSLDEGTAVGLPNREGAFIGEVVAVESSPEDAYKIAYVRSILEHHELRYVLVDTTSTWEPSAPTPEEYVDEEIDTAQ